MITLVIGVLKVFLRLDSIFSIKEKRSIIRSIVDKTRIKFKVSIAEVDQHDVWRSAVLGISLVSNNKKIVEKSINSIINYIEEDGRAEIIDYQKENLFF